MLFLVYFEVNEGMATEQNQEIAETLTGEGLFPPEGQELIRWDTTPDGWGVAVVDAEDVASLNRGINMWRAAAGDTAFFEETKTAPPVPVQDFLGQQAAMLEDLP